MSRQSDLEILQLPDDHSLEELKSAFRGLARTLHPDVGGDVGRFQAAREAYNRLLIVASMPRACQMCGGRGYTTIGQGFSPLKLVCKGCGGSGKQ